MCKVKKIVSIYIIFLIVFNLNINAAIISDNDGSAFVTKGEFDSLKKSFESQIEKYNQSLDNKIDGAISSYLSGINISSPPNNLLEKFVDTELDKPKFLNKVAGNGSNIQEMEVIINSTREHSIKYVNNLFWNSSLWHAGYATIDNALYIGAPPNWGAAYSGWTTVWRNSQARADNGNTRAGNLNAWGYYNAGVGRPTTDSKYMRTGANMVSDGKGSAWIYQLLNGKKCLKFYDTLICTSIAADVWAHSYTDCGALGDYYLADDKKGYSTELIVTADKNQTSKYGKSTAGIKYTENDTNCGAYADITIGKTETNDGNNYLNCIFANRVSCLKDIYVIDEDAQLIQADITSSKSTDATIYYDTYYYKNGEKLQSNNLSKSTLEYYSLSYPIEYMKIKEFAINSVSSLIGSTVHHGEGFPIIEFISGTNNVNVTFKFTVSSGTNNIEYKISEKRFIDGDFDPTAEIKITGTALPNASIIETLNNSSDFKANDCIWLNCYSTVDGVVVTLDSLEIG